MKLKHDKSKKKKKFTIFSLPEFSTIRVSMWKVLNEFSQKKK